MSDRRQDYFWLRFHPAKGWQIWERNPAEWADLDYGESAEAGSWAYDRVLPWIETWAEAERDGS